MPRKNKSEKINITLCVGDNKVKTLCFFGSRNLYNEDVKTQIHIQVLRFNPSTIITAGDANGICRLTREYAKENAIPLKLHFLNKKYGRGMYHHRSLAVLQECEYAIFIWDGKSKGTSNELELAKKLGKPWRLIQMESNTDEINIKEIEDLQLNLTDLCLEN